MSRARASAGCRAWAKNKKSCEERSLQEVGNLTVFAHFFGPKESGDVAVTSGDKLSGMELASFSGQKTEIESSVSVWSLFSAETVDNFTPTRRFVVHAWHEMVVV